MIGVYAFLGLLFFSGVFVGIFIQRAIFLTISKKQKETDYIEALKIFYEWRSEIGGVALKGVGQYYEKWIGEKIQKARSDAQEKTEKTPRKS